jgi:hypothetical protein
VNTHTPRKAAGLFCLFVSLAAIAAAAVDGKIESLGNNTYTATRQAKNAFNRDIDALKAAAMDDANKYCREHGKEIKVLSAVTDKPWFSTGYANAKIVFKALDAGDPELTRVPEPVGAAAGAANLAVAPAGDLYTEILKLDDLRKRGLLSDKEFEAQKKKLLKHSR